MHNASTRWDVNECHIFEKCQGPWNITSSKSWWSTFCHEWSLLTRCKAISAESINHYPFSYSHNQYIYPYVHHIAIMCIVYTWKWEKTEGAIKNVQSRDTGNIGHKIQNEDKQNTVLKRWVIRIPPTIRWWVKELERVIEIVLTCRLAIIN